VSKQVNRKLPGMNTRV